RLWWVFPAFLALIALWAVFPSWFAPMDPQRIDPRNRLLSPMSTSGEGRHWAGTGPLGIDLFPEMVAGARLTLFIALVATAIGCVIGVTFGMISGYFQGWVDRLLMRVAEAQTAMPMFLVAILLLSMLGPSAMILIVTLPALVWPVFARVVR